MSGTGGPFDSSPTWSPDATRIAYVSGGDIVVMNAATGASVNTTTAGGYPAWSPDGRRIAFASNRDGLPELYVMNPDGSDVVRVTTAVGFTGSRPSWSADSTRLAFGCEVDPGNADICVIRLDGTGFLRLTDDPASDTTPAWSPDGRTILFATTRYGGDSQLALTTPMAVRLPDRQWHYGPQPRVVVGRAPDRLRLSHRG